MKTLERRLGLGSVVAISMSSMLGSGIFVLPGLAAAETGRSLWVAYFLASICVLPAAMSKAELATAMPSSGGTYVYLERTFGPLAGTIAGLGLWLSLLLKSAFALVGIGAYVYIFAQFPIAPLALALLAVIVLLNVLGVGKVSGAVIVMVATSLLGLALLSILGGIFYKPLPEDPFLSHGIGGLLSTAGFVFVSYAGVTKVAAIAEEIIEPEKNVPRGILISLAIVTLAYCSVSVILTGNIPLAQLSGDLKPIYTLAKDLGGPIGGMIACVVAIVTMASMANSGILAASRFPFAMGRDHLLPEVFGQLNRRSLTPVISILASGLIVAVSILVFDVAKIAKYASVFMLMIYVVENIAVIILRETHVAWYKPRFEAPMYPVLQMIGIASGVALMANMSDVIGGAFLLVFLPGVALYLLYSRHRTTRRGVIGMRGVRQDLIETQPDPDHEETPLFEQSAKVVVSLFVKDHSPEMLVELGVNLADGDRVEVLHVTEVPEQTNLMDMLGESAEVRSLRRRLKALSVEKDVPVMFDPILTHDIFKTVNDASMELHCKWLIKEWRGRTAGRFTIYNPMGRFEQHIAANIMTFRDGGVRYFRKFLFIVDGGFDEFAIETASSLALSYNGTITFAHYLAPDADTLSKQRAHADIERASKHCQAPYVSTFVYGKDEPSAVISATAEHDLLVLTARPGSGLRRLFGTDQDYIMERAACSVIKIQSYRGSVLSGHPEKLETA